MFCVSCVGNIKISLLSAAAYVPYATKPLPSFPCFFLIADAVHFQVHLSSPFWVDLPGRKEFSLYSVDLISV